MVTLDDAVMNRRRLTLGIAGLAAGYVGLAAIGLAFALLTSSVSPYWPASGLAVAVLWRWGLRLWPGIVIGSLIANIAIAHNPVGVSIAYAAGSVVAALVAAGVLRRLSTDPALSRPVDPVRLMVVSAGSTLITALVGATATTMAGLTGSTPWQQVLWTWWTGDFTGVITTAGVICTVSTASWRHWRSVLGFTLLLVAASALVAWGAPREQSGLSPWAFLIFPPMLWAAVRLEPWGTACSIAVLTVALALLTASGQGPFADFASGNRSHLPFQMFAVATAITALVVTTYARSQETAREALRESERLYRLVADHSSDLICIHGLDGRYQWVSPSSSALTGWRPEELVGRDPYDFFHADDVTRIRNESHAILLAGKQRMTIAYRFRRVDGTHVWLETVNHLICDAANRPIAIQTSSRDITQRKADEELLGQVQRSAAMAERMASIGTLAGGVAHEFNNLNAVVMGNVEMALRRADLPADTRRRLDQIRDAVDREKGIVDALLAFSRSERGPTEIVDVGRVATTTLSLARRSLRQRRVTLTAEIPEQPIFATIPAGALGQVLLNLLLNACDAVDRRDDPRIWVTLARQGRRAVLTVRDNGLGIDPALSTRIFEPFFSTKGEHATDQHGQPWLRGSGLGLSVCQTLVDQMSGSIAVDSRPACGATFTVTVPLSDAPRLNPNTTITTTPCARVLVVDDEPEIRRLLCEHLIAAGHVALEAKEGQQALDHLVSEEIDLIMLNWSMPGIDGQGVLEHIELHPERRWPPVIVVSGWTGSGSGIDRWRNEIAGQLRKPFSLEQVRSAVDRALCGQRDQSDDDSRLL